MRSTRFVLHNQEHMVCKSHHLRFKPNPSHKARCRDESVLLEFELNTEEQSRK
jgi:hypothetical protein